MARRGAGEQTLHNLVAKEEKRRLASGDCAGMIRDESVDWGRRNFKANQWSVYEMGM
jgi:hypothetical protein